jgi:hypothetical protein
VTAMQWTVFALIAIICVLCVVVIHAYDTRQGGMPSRRQRRQWERERLVQPQWSRRWP